MISLVDNHPSLCTRVNYIVQLRETEAAASVLLVSSHLCQGAEPELLALAPLVCICSITNRL